MRKLWFGLLFLTAAAVAVPRAAQAGWLVEGSFGKSLRLKPNAGFMQTDFMLTPGYSFMGLLRAELGLLAKLPDIKESKFNLEFRPMLTIAPPLLPLYGRLIIAVTDVIDNSYSKRAFAFGAAAGIKLGLGPIGVFAELGIIPRSIDSTLVWVGEGRIGALLEF